MNKIFTYRSIGLLLVLLALVGAGVYAFIVMRSDTPSSPPRGAITHAVMLTEDGFEPKELQIQVGDTVVFTTTRSSSFWPASDLHPTHELYPEFDPKQPVPANSSWQFTFTKSGTWKYHDHLFPLYRGIIIVNGATVGQADTQVRCTAKADTPECWQKDLAALAQAKGVAAAFDEVARLYAEEPEFESGCHSYGHKIGEIAYEQFSRGTVPEFTSKASYCGYGYYHGFMEALLHTSNDIEQARLFCRGTTQQVEKGFGRHIEAACYHGMGHGAVEEGDLKTAQTADRFVEPGLTLCEMVADTFERKKICGSGVYNSLANAWFRDETSSAIDRLDPFNICAKVAKAYFRISCLHQMNTVVARVTKGDFSQSIALVERLALDEDAIPAMDGVATQFGLGKEKDMDPAVIAQGCLQAQTRLQKVCIKAYVGGLIEGGKPNEEHVDALAFCEKDLKGSSFQSECYSGFVSSIYAWLPKDKAAQICNTIPAEQKQLCSQT